ncbi:MAG TPA: N-acetylglucosamine-6-phosphate deacetylase [Vicinamibacterales bacterium]|nr:N-acetylglucosamine-6-phosphate deacetylase [Vicinamibacterales bacterium]
MVVLSGADLILPAGISSGGTLVIDGDRIVDVLAPDASLAPGASVAPIDCRGHYIVPGFIDVHVHGLEGVDTLDGPAAVADMARRLPKFGVTAFCPTTVACSPEALREMLRSVGELRGLPPASSARVLPAHLESNFINPEFRGAQPLGCLRIPPSLGATGMSAAARSAKADATGAFSGAAILAEIDRAGANVGIVTLAPELEGAIDLIRHLVSRGRRVSLGHSGATLEQSRAAIAAGARHATHLFNRMPPLSHRDPGLVGAILTSKEIAAEVICDGVHVHGAMVRMAISAKGAHRMMAITDGVAAAGLPEGSTASLGGRRIRVERSAAYLDDGTLAGSVATMNRVFRFLVRDIGLPLKDAVQMTATTPASELGLTEIGTIATGAIADLVVMDREFNVKQTYVGGRLAYESAVGSRQ